jgi:DNA replicative helicase MCM subunit Mcm2 (Cdc46/Mcm family)
MPILPTMPSDRAIRLFEYYLSCMADENGNLDYDRFGNTMDTNDRNVNQVVEKIIKSKGKDGISFLDIVDEAKELGWDKESVESAVSFLNNKGSVYVSTGGKYKLVE